MSKRMFGAVAILAVACLAVAFGGLTPALAGLGEPTDGQLGLQLPASPIMQEISDLFNVVNIVIVVIALFVLVLMVWVIYRFSEKNNPTPSRITHQHRPRSCLDDPSDPDPRWHFDPFLPLAVQSVHVSETRSDDQGHGQRLVLGA